MNNVKNSDDSNEGTKNEEELENDDGSEEESEDDRSEEGEIEDDDDSEEEEMEDDIDACSRKNEINNDKDNSVSAKKYVSDNRTEGQVLVQVLDLNNDDFPITNTQKT